MQSTAQVHGNTGLSNQVHDFLVQRSPSSIYSWSIGHILDHEFFCLGRLGSQGSKGKKVDLRDSEQLLRVVFPTFGGQNKHFKKFKKLF